MRNERRSGESEHAGGEALTKELCHSVKIVTIAGCLAIVYMHLLRGAHQVAFARELGARPFHFGVIGAIPPLMLSFQFVSALFINRLRHRKRSWMMLLIIRRSSVCLLGLVPWLLPNAPAAVVVWTFIGMLAIGHAMETLAQPVFFAWMGSLLPRDSFTEIWAGRRRWLSWTRAGMMLALAFAMWVLRDANIRVVFAVMACLAAVAGTIDILLFAMVPEPPAKRSASPHFDRLVEPFRQTRVRRDIRHDCVLRFGASMAAPLFRIFLLQEIGLSVHAILLLFACHALGGTLFARRIGRLADRVGHRPVIVLGAALKCVIAVAMFALLPGAMVLLLVPVLVLDNMLNTALLVSRTGFTVKQSPEANRAMFVAAVLATGGLAAALGAFCGGLLMDHLPVVDLSIGTWTLTRFRMVFALSAVFRFAGFLMAIRLHEPGSTEATVVLRDVVRPALQRPLIAPFVFVRDILTSDDD